MFCREKTLESTFTERKSLKGILLEEDLCNREKKLQRSSIEYNFWRPLGWSSLQKISLMGVSRKRSLEDLKVFLQREDLSEVFLEKPFRESSIKRTGVRSVFNREKFLEGFYRENIIQKSFRERCTIGRRRPLEKLEGLL